MARSNKENEILHTDDSTSESSIILDLIAQDSDKEETIQEKLNQDFDQISKIEMSNEDLDFLSDNFKEVIQTEFQKQQNLISDSLKLIIEEKIGTQLFNLLASVKEIDSQHQLLDKICNELSADAKAVNSQGQSFGDMSHELLAEVKSINAQNQLFDKMYDELQVYKKGFHLHLFKPILSSLIQLNDNLRLILSYQQTNVESKPTEELYALLKDEYENVIFQIEDIVAENGLMKFNGPLAGEPFDPLCQTIKSVREANLPIQNKTISEVLAPGYKQILEDGKEFLFRKEYVEIYKYNTEK